MRTLGILILTAAMAMGQQTAAQQTAAIGELEARLAQLRTKYTANHPEVVAVMSQLNEAKARLVLRTAVDAQRQSQDAATRNLQSQTQEIIARYEELQSQKAKLQAERMQQDQKLRAQIDGVKASIGTANLPDTWWRNEGMAKQIGLSSVQVKRMDEIFQQSRLKMIDQKAALDKEEAILEPLIAADTLDEARAASQVDRVAQARAELEKTRGRLLLGIRKQMEPEQWRKLNETRFVIEKPSTR